MIPVSHTTWWLFIRARKPKMRSGADQIFELYSRYVADLQRSLSALPSGAIADKFRVRCLSPEQFVLMWTSWDHCPSLQDEWKERFKAGYAADSDSISNRLAAKLPSSGTNREAA